MTTTTPQTEASRLVEMADELERVCHDWTIAHIASAELRRLVAENSDLRERNAALGNAQEIALDTATEHALRADELRDRLAAAEAERDQLRAQVERLQGGEAAVRFCPGCGIEQCPNHIHEQKKGLTPQQAFKRIAAVTSMLILTACGGGGWEEECKANGGELVTNEAGDLVCMTNNRLPALPGPGQGG